MRGIYIFTSVFPGWLCKEVEVELRLIDVTHVAVVEVGGLLHQPSHVHHRQVVYVQHRACKTEA